jgi:RHS repeat-associated protein
LCRISQGNLAIDRQFTGQILDSTGLYYYNARYYDPTIGRFISPDTVGQIIANPQTLNRYSYCLNNPLNQTDPTGHFSINWKTVLKVATVVVAVAAVVAVAVVAPALIMALAPALAAAAPAITGALVGAASYTATKIAVNTVNERPALEGFSALDCATNAAAGACFSQVTSIIGYAILNQPINVGSENVSLNTGAEPEVHGNSLSTTKTAYGYALTDKDTGEVLKYGETIHPEIRYTKSYLDSINANMDILAQGAKTEMHFWQNDQILDYFAACGQNPIYNFNNW